MPFGSKQAKYKKSLKKKEKKKVIIILLEHYNPKLPKLAF